MSMQLTDKEAMLILQARKYANTQFWSMHLLLGAIFVTYFASSFDLISIQVFSGLALAFSASYLASMHSNKYPTYEKLLSMIEQKVSESSEAIQAVNAIKNGT